MIAATALQQQLLAGLSSPEVLRAAAQGWGFVDIQQSSCCHRHCDIVLPAQHRHVRNIFFQIDAQIFYLDPIDAECIDLMDKLCRNVANVTRFDTTQNVTK